MGETQVDLFVLILGDTLGRLVAGESLDGQLHRAVRHGAHRGRLLDELEDVSAVFAQVQAVVPLEIGGQVCRRFAVHRRR